MRFNIICKLSDGRTMPWGELPMTLEEARDFIRENWSRLNIKLKIDPGMTFWWGEIQL